MHSPAGHQSRRAGNTPLRGAACSGTKWNSCSEVVVTRAENSKTASAADAVVSMPQCSQFACACAAAAQAGLPIVQYTSTHCTSSLRAIKQQLRTCPACREAESARQAVPRSMRAPAPLPAASARPLGLYPVSRSALAGLTTAAAPACPPQRAVRVTMSAVHPSGTWYLKMAANQDRGLMCTASMLAARG